MREPGPPRPTRGLVGTTERIFALPAQREGGEDSVRNLQGTSINTTQLRFGKTETGVAGESVFQCGHEHERAEGRARGECEGEG